MAKKKVESESLDFLAFTSVASDVKNQPIRNLQQELYSRDWKDQTVSAFEKQQGFATKAAEKLDVKHKVRVFSPDNVTDRNLLDQLMNSPNHKITYWKDNWTPAGEYRVFVIYSEVVQKEDNSEQK